MRRVPTYYQDLIEVIGSNPGHVIGSTACLGGTLPTQLIRYRDSNLLESDRKDYYELILQWCRLLKNLFGEDNFYLEMQPSLDKDQIYVNKEIVKISKILNIPYIITTDSHYLKKEDAPIHEAYLNAQDGDREVRSFYATTYMMSTEELESYMLKSLSLEEIQTAYQNIYHIKESCQDYSLLKPLRIPDLKWKKHQSKLTEKERAYYRQFFPSIINFENSSYKGDKVLVEAIYDALDLREEFRNQETYDAIEDNLSATWKSSVKNNAHWSAYYLNLQNIIDICWEAGTLVGPGRGSGVGFFLLYLFDITQINPLWEDTATFSWRFLNPDRVSVLDIDVDIEGGKRTQVLKALRSYYGEDNVANVATFRTEKSKAAILTACLKPGTMVNTSSGPKEIEKITNEDVVDTTEGPQKVLTPTHRQYDGELYTFNTASAGLPFSVTHNHQLLVYTNRKKKEKDGCQNYKECQLIDSCGNILGTFSNIKQASRYYATKYNGSFSSMYRYKTTNGYSIIENPTIQNHQIQWLTAEDIQQTDFLLSPIYNQDGEIEDCIFFSQEEQNPYQKSVTYIKDKIQLNEEFCELIGIYLAEGNINHGLHGITFTIHQDEIWLRERIIYLLENVFGITKENLSILLKQESRGLSIQVNSTPLGRFFNKYFPNKCDKKTVGFIKKLPAKMQLYTLYGCYYGDGHGRQRKNHNYEGKITSVSYQLIIDLWQIAANNGYNCSVITEKNRTPQEKIAYNLMFYGKTAECLYNSKYLHLLDLNWEYQKPIEYNGKKYYPIKIKSIVKERYKGEVFCLETPAHNYLLNNIISHNCRGLKIDVDTAQYLAGLIPSDRGQTRTLKQCFYGDEEAGFAPIKIFVEEMTNNYPELWEVAQKIEGLVCGLGVHAGGVIFVDEPFTNSTALMRAPDGTIITAFDLHDAEDCSLIKYDLLSVECLDRMHNCIDLICDYGYFKREDTLKATYEKMIGIYNIERTEPKMWEMVWNHQILSLFQMEQQSGIQGIALTHPKSVDELAVLNSVIRLMAQKKGAEQPLNKFARFKENPQAWINEMNYYGLSEEEQELLRPILKISYGICESQEKFMQLVQIPECGGFDLDFADRLRKAIAKKKPKEYNSLTKEYFEKVEEKHLSRPLCEYVWNVLVATSRG